MPGDRIAGISFAAAHGAPSIYPDTGFPQLFSVGRYVCEGPLATNRDSLSRERDRLPSPREPELCSASSVSEVTSSVMRWSGRPKAMDSVDGLAM